MCARRYIQQPTWGRGKCFNRQLMYLSIIIFGSDCQRWFIKVCIRTYKKLYELYTIKQSRYKVIEHRLIQCIDNIILHNWGSISTNFTSIILRINWMDIRKHIVSIRQSKTSSSLQFNEADLILSWDYIQKWISFPSLSKLVFNLHGIRIR